MVVPPNIYIFELLSQAPADHLRLTGIDPLLLTSVHPGLLSLNAKTKGSLSWLFSISPPKRKIVSLLGPHIIDVALACFGISTKLVKSTIDKSEPKKRSKGFETSK